LLRANAEYLAREALELTEDDVLDGSAPLAHAFGMRSPLSSSPPRSASRSS
jgi:hypothetical protein